MLHEVAATSCLLHEVACFMNLRGVKSSCDVAVDARVAQSQWHHWIGSKDPWKQQGEVLKAVRDLQLL